MQNNSSTAAVHQALKSFDELPDSAYVALPVVCSLFSCSPATAWRRVRDGLLVAPRRIGTRTTRWQVGELREALAKVKEEAMRSFNLNSVDTAPTASIQPQAIGCISSDWLAAGKSRVLAGMPGAGKTTISLEMTSLNPTIGLHGRICAADSIERLTGGGKK